MTQEEFNKVLIDFVEKQHQINAHILEASNALARAIEVLAKIESQKYS